MDRGKASCEDGLVAEHLKFAQPAQIKLLVKLLNYILLYGLVPSLFGICITISILKESNAKSRLSTDEFWGITVSPVLPKVFEQALLFNFENYFVSSDEQFRFKKAIGCNHAILAVKSTIDHFVKHGSTVNICRLDISKAVDKIQHCILFDKLIKHCIPISLVKVLLFWYSNSICKVKWLHAFSFSYTFGAGVRQGGGSVITYFIFCVCRGLVTKASCFKLWLFYCWSMFKFNYVCWWLNSFIFICYWITAYGWSLCLWTEWCSSERQP